jgi:hypothetical protein
MAQLELPESKEPRENLARLVLLEILAQQEQLAHLDLLHFTGKLLRLRR